MGRYVEQILQPDEKVLYTTTRHWIIYVPAMLAWIAVIACLVATQWVVSSNATLFLLATASVIACIAVYWTARGWFDRWTCETDVTTLRVVHKDGFIKRRTFEMSMDKIESVDVNQSILGRILGFGDVTIRGVGEGRETIPMIAAPIEFRNFITAR